MMADLRGDAGTGEVFMNSHERTISLSIPGDQTIEGSLAVVEQPIGTIVFAHGSGSSRHSPRNRFVATTLQRLGFATVLVDLLTADEEEEERSTGHLRFDIELLAERLGAVTQWVLRQPELQDRPIGYFGASTGAAAALVAAARQGETIAAVVSRGGRPDLADDVLPHVQAPTLLIVGEADSTVLALNRDALRQLVTIKKLEIVPNATHLFPEPGALAHVAELAGRWFLDQLRR